MAEIDSILFYTKKPPDTTKPESVNKMWNKWNRTVPEFHQNMMGKKILF